MGFKYSTNLLSGYRCSISGRGKILLFFSTSQSVSIHLVPGNLYPESKRPHINLVPTLKVHGTPHPRPIFAFPDVMLKHSNNFISPSVSLNAADKAANHIRLSCSRCFIQHWYQSISERKIEDTFSIFSLCLWMLYISPFFCRFGVPISWIRDW